MSDIVVTTTFLGPIGLWKEMVSADTVWIEAHESYQKRSYRQRAYIMGVNGLLMLSVPLEGGKHQGLPIKEVSISYEHDWVGPMLHAIRSALGSAPYFEYYYSGLEQVLRGQHSTLWQLNQATHQYLCESLMVDVPLMETSAYHKVYETTEDLRRYRDKPKKGSLVRYEQVWADRQGFWEGLSIIDLLFCTGPAAITLLSD